MLLIGGPLMRFGCVSRHNAAVALAVLWQWSDDDGVETTKSGQDFRKFDRP